MANGDYNWIPNSRWGGIVILNNNVSQNTYIKEIPYNSAFEVLIGDDVYASRTTNAQNFRVIYRGTNPHDVHMTYIPTRLNL